MNPVGQIIEFVLWLFIAFVLARLVVDWIQMFAREWNPHGVSLVVLEGVYSATDPPIRLFRRLIPPLRLGGMTLDLSLMIVLVLAFVLRYVNRLIWPF